jgi:hypothetical protein
LPGCRRSERRKPLGPRYLKRVIRRAQTEIRDSPVPPRGTGGSPGNGEWLLRHYEVAAPILLPAIFIFVGAERVLFAPARRGYPVG